MEANGTGVLMPNKGDDQRWLAVECIQGGDLRLILDRVISRKKVWQPTFSFCPLSQLIN
jgi:hypothetical protein